MAGIDAHGTSVLKLLVAACDKAKNSLDEETGHTLTQGRIDSDLTPTPNLAGRFPVITYAAKAYMPD